MPSRRARGGSQSAGVRPDEPCDAVVLLCQSFSSPLLQYKQAVQDRHSGRYRKSCRGRDEERRGLCYDQHQVWMVTVVVTLPETVPCVLRGGSETGGQGQFLTRILA